MTISKIIRQGLLIVSVLAGMPLIAMELDLSRERQEKQEKKLQTAQKVIENRKNFINKKIFSCEYSLKNTKDVERRKALQGEIDDLYGELDDLDIWIKKEGIIPVALYISKEIIARKEAQGQQPFK